VGGLAAARSPGVAFLVQMATPAVPGELTLELQRNLIHKNAGTEPDLLYWENELVGRLQSVAKAGEDPKNAGPKMAEIARQAIESGPKSLKKEEYIVGLDSEIRQMLTPWYRFFLTYDPRPTLSKVLCPVLSVIGSSDVQVPPEPNLTEFKKAMQSGGSHSATAVELPGLNHLLQTSHGETPSGYGGIQETMSPVALELIGNWILKNVRER
jgi:hypothetical protein